MVLVDTEGRSVSGEGPQGGADAVAVELRDASGAVTRHASVPALSTVSSLHQLCWDVVELRVLAETCGAVTRHAPVLALPLCPRALRTCSRKQVLRPCFVSTRPSLRFLSILGSCAPVQENQGSTVILS